MLSLIRLTGWREVRAIVNLATDLTAGEKWRNKSNRP